MSERQCYICYDGDETLPLITPCSCNTYVHSLCISRFEAINNLESSGTCGICRKKYALMQYNFYQTMIRTLLFIGNDKIYLFTSVMELLLISSVFYMCERFLHKSIIITAYSLFLGIFMGTILYINYMIFTSKLITNAINNIFIHNLTFLQNNFLEMLFSVITLLFPTYYSIAFSTLVHYNYALLFTQFISSSFVLWIVLMGKINNMRKSYIIKYPKYSSAPLRQYAKIKHGRNKCIFD